MTETSLLPRAQVEKSFPAVTVLMAVYNCNSEVRDAIMSIKAQEDVTTELILVDDGSNEETVRLLLSIIDEYGTGVRLVHKKNGGPASARNFGLRHASHDWIAFLDQDDLWEPNKLSRQLEEAIKDSADFVCTGTENIGTAERVDNIREVPSLMSNIELYEQLLTDNFVTMSSAIVRRSVLVENGGFDEQWMGVEDWAMWLLCARQGRRFCGINEPLIKYRWSEGQLSKRHDVMQDQRRKLIVSELATDEAKKLPLSARRKILAEERLCSAWYAAGSCRFLAAKLYLQAVSLWPFRIAPWKGLAKCVVGGGYRGAW